MLGLGAKDMELINLCEIIRKNRKRERVAGSNAGRRRENDKGERDWPQASLIYSICNFVYNTILTSE